ncbi:hypothetical protein CC1G_15156 [Coprinopsis cinerea okayama7|uniref:Uncharacterized protein n=1 Tax=Coprinopsis cinerea (strain Okayama-7 / 130 / ATCC MYA-4618 / FGSC 9003) TaxID=240176 RepID=D6RPS3_COPC7|nr:hypothetical protein CC1G_15156 [Coprinopsis cinerea okayama7\|eukprot:XP_002910517.1 hypothetical protein CC1G_15156 [Coprinopsis cinerea okayama7\
MVVPCFLRHKPKDFGLSHERADPAQCGARKVTFAEKVSVKLAESNFLYGESLSSRDGLHEPGEEFRVAKGLRDDTVPTSHDGVIKNLHWILPHCDRNCVFIIMGARQQTLIQDCTAIIHLVTGWRTINYHALLLFSASHHHPSPDKVALEPRTQPLPTKSKVVCDSAYRARRERDQGEELSGKFTIQSRICICCESTTYDKCEVKTLWS